jgi:phage gp16-like protein
MSSSYHHRQNEAAERGRLIRLLHVAKRDLSMEDADYRTVLQTASKGQHDSSSDMSLTDLEHALAHMKRCGFKVRTKGKRLPSRGKDATRTTPPSRALDTSPEGKKIRAIWIMLHELGAVQNASEEALAAYVKRMTTVDAIQWLNGTQAERVIETLKKWALRYLPGAVDKLVDQVKETRRLGYMEAMRLNGLLSLARSRGTFDPMKDAWEALRDVLQGRKADSFDQDVPV